MIDFSVLFKEWQDRYSFSSFIEDGIVDEEQYESPHVLFVLRDMNCSSSCDLRQYLREEGGGCRTWNNVARWTAALLDGGEFYPRNMSKEERIKQLCRVAAINIKKEGGVSRANGEELVSFAKAQRKQILSEIELCDPDIIICCGQGMQKSPSNAVILEQQVFKISPDWKHFPSEKLPREWHYFEVLINNKYVPVISFCHPQVTNLCGKRGHDGLYEPLYKDMLQIRNMFLV